MLLEDTFELFSKFGIITSSEDFDQIDGLSYSYEKLLIQVSCLIFCTQLYTIKKNLFQAKHVSNEIFSQQQEWTNYLLDGISTLQNEIEIFDLELDQGDLTENLSAKVAKDRVSILSFNE